MYSHYRQWFMTKIHVWRIVLFVRRRFEHCVLISNTTLGLSGYRTKPPSSRLGTLYSYYRQGFMTKIHVFRVVLLVRRLFKRCVSISNSTLRPSGHDLKPPSLRLGTLYSHYRQWFMTEINVLRLVLSRLGTLYSYHKQLFVTKIHLFSLVLFVRSQFKRLGVDFKHHTVPQWPW